MSFKTILFLLFFLGIVFSASSCMANPVERIEENLNMSVADILTMVVSCGIVIIVAFDARIALMCALLSYTSLFIVFTFLTDEGFSNFNPYYTGVAMMVCFVIICASLLITYKKSNTPFNVV